MGGHWRSRVEGGAKREIEDSGVIWRCEDGRYRGDLFIFINFPMGGMKRIGGNTLKVCILYNQQLYSAIGDLDLDLV